MKADNRQIRFFLPGLIVMLIIILAAPVFYGYQNTCPGKQFMGVTGLYPLEQFYYMSVGPSQAVRGNLLFADRYGRIEDKKVLVNPIANVIGFLARAFATSLPVAFNIFRILSSILLVLSFFYLSKQFVKSNIALIMSVVIYCCTGGFAAIYNLMHISSVTSVDDSIPETNMFMAMSGEYYLPCANALFIIALTFAYKLFFKGERKLLWCGCSLFMLGAVYIYGLVCAVIIISVAALMQGYYRKTIPSAILILLKLSFFCLPVILYYLWLMLQYPVIAEEAWFPFPEPLSFLSTFGFGFLFAVIGLLIKSKVEIYSEGYLLIWVLLTIFLIYFPHRFLPIQIQIAIGLGAPLSILFANSLEVIRKFLAVKFLALGQPVARIMAAGAIIFTIALSSFTNFKFYAGQFSDLGKQSYPLYLNSKICDAMQWSAKNIPDTSLVITSRKLEFIFSATTACKIYCVAPDDMKTNEPLSTELWIPLVSSGKVNEAVEALHNTGANYLFLDQSLDSTNFVQIRKTLKGCFKECYINNEVSIFQIK